MDELPSYADLPPAPDGARTAWGLFGPDDNLGLLNLLTADRVREAAKLVRRGALFPLNAPLDAFSPALAASRGIPRHQVLHVPGTWGFDDVLDNFYPQGSSQWDSLGHVGYGPNMFYNGATEEDIATGRRNTIDHWARRGIAGRAVVLDMPRTFAAAGRPYDPGTSTALQRRGPGGGPTAGGRGVPHRGHSAVTHRLCGLVYQPAPGGSGPGRRAPGRLRASPTARRCAPICGTATWPPSPPTPMPSKSCRRTATDRPVSCIGSLIGQFGMALGELWWTEELAADCADDGVYEVFLASAPLHAPGGIGSSANALAMK